jgi:hypothetical protein
MLDNDKCLGFVFIKEELGLPVTGFGIEFYYLRADVLDDYHTAPAWFSMFVDQMIDLAIKDRNNGATLTIKEIKYYWTEYITHKTFEDVLNGRWAGDKEKEIYALLEEWNKILGWKEFGFDGNFER